MRNNTEKLKLKRYEHALVISAVTTHFHVVSSKKILFSTIIGPCTTPWLAQGTFRFLPSCPCGIVYYIQFCNSRK